MTAKAKLIRVAAQLADRFERVGLDEAGHMDKADKRLLDRVRKAIADCTQKPKPQKGGK